MERHGTICVNVKFFGIRNEELLGRRTDHEAVVRDIDDCRFDSREKADMRLVVNHYVTKAWEPATHQVEARDGSDSRFYGPGWAGSMLF